MHAWRRYPSVEVHKFAPSSSDTASAVLSKVYKFLNSVLSNETMAVGSVQVRATSSVRVSTHTQVLFCAPQHSFTLKVFLHPSWPSWQSFQQHVRSVSESSGMFGMSHSYTSVNTKLPASAPVRKEHRMYALLPPHTPRLVLQRLTLARWWHAGSCVCAAETARWCAFRHG